MTPPDVARDVLLAAGVAVELFCYAGVLLARTAYDRLHYVVPATAIAPVLIVAAIVVQEGTSTSAVKALLIGVGMVALGPVLSHATARAIRIRGLGQWIVLAEERPREERRHR